MTARSPARSAFRASAMNPERLLARFLRYVQVHTTAREDAGVYPSSPGQFDLGRIVVEELRAAGITDATQDERGLVWGTVPATVSHAAPTIAFNAHLDTSPETSGENVRPQVIRGYAGGDIVLPGDRRQVIRVAENPELTQLVGRTLVTTDGTTLLGADDKAGVAVIVELSAWLAEHPEIPHGPIRVLFTCDEEIGHGVDHVDLARLGATACYTLDGGGTDAIDVETFSADLAKVTVHGKNIHPSIAKGRMMNALRAAGDFLTRLPRETLAPEVSADREGFLHPYQMEGGVAEARLRILLRDFDTPRLADHAAILHGAARATEQAWPGCRVEIEMVRQYRNLADGLAREPRAVGLAVEALERLGRVPRREIIRGGTDGSRLTELGLPTPNLSTGEHNPHSPLEWTCLEEMVQAVEWLVALAERWGRERG